MCLSVFPPGRRRSQWKRRNHCNGGKHEGVTLLPLTSPENASLSCKESRLIPSFSPPNPTHHVSHLDWRPLGQKRGRGGGLSLRVGSQTGDRGLNWEKKFNHNSVALAALAQRHSFFSVSLRTHHVSPQRLTKAAGECIWSWGEIGSHHRKV